MSCKGRHCAHDFRCYITEAPPVAPGPFERSVAPLVARCTCGPWNSILPPPACPAHGRFEPIMVTCGTISGDGHPHPATKYIATLNSRP